MVRHIELTLEHFDLTCWGEKEDFENDTEDGIKEGVYDYLYDSWSELIHQFKIKKIWYEEDE